MIRWIFATLLLVIKCPGFTEDLQHDLQDWQKGSFVAPSAPFQKFLE